MRFVTVSLLAIIGIGLMLVGCRASGEIDPEGATRITAPAR
jgi:hypothetical protein